MVIETFFFTPFPTETELHEKMKKSDAEAVMVWVVGGAPAVLTGSTLISDYVSTRPLNASFFPLLQGKLRNTELAKVQISGH